MEKLPDNVSENQKEVTDPVPTSERVVAGDERLVAGAEAKADFVETLKPNTEEHQTADITEAKNESDTEAITNVDAGTDVSKKAKQEGANGTAEEQTAEESTDITDVEEESQENSDGAGEGTEPHLDDEGRTMMFEDGLKHDKVGEKNEALKCYLRCLVGLKQDSRFALLPQCLRNIADIYFSRDEYDKAVSFIQAEKLYYESVLIDDSELQKHIEEAMAAGDPTGEKVKDIDIDALRATEYEQLARLCMDEKQPVYYRPQLALEYAGKATKLRQKVYGDGHPIVQQTLDFFATVYAEVGKVQYTESMGKYDPSEKLDLSGEIKPASSSTTEPTSILRKRKSTVEAERSRRVRFDENQVPPEEAEREEKCARFVLLLLFITLLFVLLVLGVYISCSLSPSTGCRNVRRLIYDVVMRLRYWYYHYTTSSQDVQYA
ncbi:uncharacterized protein LOC127873248 isoform X1 [Dreissena polymorpha]|nr:uncharacterized protein LOC127873248 isoform X1 [Dreissena polymorpha]